MKQWLKVFSHNVIVHPMLMFLPTTIGNYIHDKNAKWCWGDHDKDC